LRIIGKIPAGSSEVTPTRPRRDKLDAIQTASRKRVGVADILNWVGKESGIDQDLFSSTDRATAEKVLSIARCWTVNPGKTMPYIEEWQITHDIPYKDGMSQDSCYLPLRHHLQIFQLDNLRFEAQQRALTHEKFMLGI
jgi:hypothetical protein